VDDFYSYGNVDELPKYMKKAQTLSTKLELSKEKVIFKNLFFFENG